MFKGKKYLFLLFPVTFSYSGNLNWEDFDNNFYTGGGVVINSVSVSPFGVTSNNFGQIEFGATGLFLNGIYFNIEGDAQFTAGGSFISNWYSSIFKLGYSIQPKDSLNFIPYLSLGYGNAGAFYSRVDNLSYGIGILSEFMYNSNISIYFDLGYQLQNYSSEINSDFNKNVLNNFAVYNLSATPSIIDTSIGLKYINSEGYYFNPFFKYQSYQQSFSSSGITANYGVLNSIVAQYQFGVNIGLSI